jgi:hypothetical protein
VVGTAIVWSRYEAPGDEERSRAAPQADAERALTESLERPRDGYEAAYPAEWVVAERKGIVNLESPDRCIAISLSAPVPTAQAGRLERDLTASLRRTYGKLKVVRRSERIGGKPTRTSFVAVRSKTGDPVVVRQSVTPGAELAHLTQVIQRAPPCEAYSEQAGLILGSIEFTK